MTISASILALSLLAIAVSTFFTLSRQSFNFNPDDDTVSFIADGDCFSKTGRVWLGILVGSAVFCIAASLFAFIAKI